MVNIRESAYKYQLINIKLQTNKKGDDKSQAYEKLIRDLVRTQIHIPIAKDKHMIIFSCFDGATEGGIKYLYGNLGKGICFEKDLIDNIVINESEMKQEMSDRGRIFNSENARYIFFWN